jgi:3-methyladenine DNA glycosylase AlkD
MRTVIERLTREYETARDPERAAPMTTYMRDLFPFLGIKSTPRRLLSKRVLDGVEKPNEAQLAEVALAGWALPEREYQHFAVDWLRQHAKVLTEASLPTVQYLITTKSWWDTVDELASDVVGVMVQRHPGLLSTMDAWATGSDPTLGWPAASPKASPIPELWLARTAILHQLRYRAATDTDRLFRYCAENAEHRDFFIRKAVGWALRQYAKTDPDAVRSFVADHPELSTLSKREALKNL